MAQVYDLLYIFNCKAMNDTTMACYLLHMFNLETMNDTTI